MATVVGNGGAAPKIRLVQCPRCKQILPELPNVPVYQCGGCGIHLQAKIRPRNGETNSPSAPTNGSSSLSSSASTADSSAHLNRLDSSSSSSVHQPAVQESSLDLGNNTNESTLVDEPVKLADDRKSEGRDDDHGETRVSNGDCREEIEDNDQAVKDEVADDDHGETSASSTDSTSSVEKPDAGVESEAEIQQVNATFEDRLDAIRSSSDDSVDETTPQGTSTVAAVIRPPPCPGQGDVVESPPPEQLNMLQEKVRFDGKRYADTFEADEFVSSELSEVLVDLTKSPTTRSCHAYYDGISSYEGTDDQVPGRPRPYSRNLNIHRPGSYMIAEEKAEGDYLLPSRNNNLGMQYEQKKYHSPDINLDSDELPVRSWGRRLESDDELIMAQPPRHPRTSYTNGYESGSTSYQSRSGLNNSNLHLRVNAADIEQERVRLLRMVYELEDQLTRSCSMNDQVSSRKAFSGNVPLSYGMNPGPYSREASGWSQQQRQPTRIPFSAEAAINGRQKVDHHSSCCNPQEWKCSCQLPTHCPNHNRVFCRAHSGASFCNSYGSCPSSPQRHVGSEYQSVHGRTTMSCEQRQNRDHHDLKRHQFAVAKRHLRPVAGGAPFVACPSCLKQLQLPADFLLSKRKLHMLRCGACSETLRFSLVNRTHLAPYSSSKAGSDRDIANSSSGSFKQKKVVPDRVMKSQGKVHVEETFDGAGPSHNEEKGSVKIEEEIRGRGGSPLHRLMGYSTLSGVLRN